MADCISCDKLVECSEDKVSQMMKVGECADYVELRVGSRKAPRICKYCGEEYSNSQTSGVCTCCYHKVKLLPRFREARDVLREKLGLKRMGDV